jgi:hypothetical protein
MAAVARVLSRPLAATESEVETLKIIIMVCGAGLVVSLLLAGIGLDISAGLF